MGSGEIKYEKVYGSPRPPPKISFKDNWMRELGSEVAGGGKDSEQTQPKTKNPNVRTGRLVLAGQPSGSSAQDIDKRVFLDCESTNVRTGRPVSSCVPVSVERLDQDKDADENVEADHVRTGRPVGKWTIHRFVHTSRGNRHWLQSVWIVTCSCENKQKTSVFANSWRRSRVTRIDKHFKPICNKITPTTPVCDESQAMTRENGQCRVVRVMRNNSKSAMLRMPSLLESRNSLLHLWTSLERKRIQPNFSPMATACLLNPELRHQEGATSWCSARQNWSTERAFRGPQCEEEMSNNNPARSNVSWFAREVHRDGQISTRKPLLLPILWGVREIQENWFISLNKSGRNAPMKHRSDFREALKNMHRLHRESGEERPEPIPFYQYQNWHSSSSWSGTSQNGLKRVTNGYVDWSLTFIIHVNINSIVMWETLQNNADWDCFKTPISQEILRIQNLHQVEHCAFSEVIRLFQSAGCVSDKFQFHTIQQNQKSFPWTQDWGWTVSPHLIDGIWSSQFMDTRIRVIKNKRLVNE